MSFNPLHVADGRQTQERVEQAVARWRFNPLHVADGRQTAFSKFSSFIHEGFNPLHVADGRQTHSYVGSLIKA